jgi:hypothetical protein
VSERILLLGAGASFGARVGLGERTNDEPLPPLGRGLADYLVRWIRANDLSRKLRPVMGGYCQCPHFTGRRIWRSDELGAVWEALSEVAARERQDASSVAFEVLMDEWSISGQDRRLLGFTQTLLAYAMVVGYRCAFVEARDRLDSLVASVRPTMVVTVNYDTLTEEALLRGGMRFTYPNLPGPRPPGLDDGDYVSSLDPGHLIPMFKLHGSINWLPVSGGAAGADLATVESISSARPTRVLPSGPLTASQTWATYVPPDRRSLFIELERALSGTGSPVTAVYGTGKNLLNNPLPVQNHRDSCVARLRDADIDQVIAVGIRPVSVEDDPVVGNVVELLAGQPAEKVYVSPGGDDCEEFRARGFSPIQATLEGYLAAQSIERPG